MTAKLPGPLSKYQPDYCEQVGDFLAKGHSVGAFAGHIGVHRDTIYEWTKHHSDFEDALKIGINRATKFWEERLIEIATNGKDKGNPAAIIFGLKNRASADWKDTMVNEHTGANGAPLTVMWKPAVKEQSDG